MELTVVPTIKHGKVFQISIFFGRPMALSDFSRFLESINRQLSPRGMSEVKNSECIRYPVYSNGEMIAVVEKYPDGKTIRTYV